MALGKNCTSKARPCGLRTSKADALDERLDFGNCTTRTLRRKRVVVSNYMELSSSSPPLKTPSKKRIGARLNSERDDWSPSTLASPFKTPTKKRLGSRLDSQISSLEALPQDKPLDSRLDSQISSLEALPQDILVRLLCFVDHDDLKQLFHVSPIVREATLIAKEWHFAFSTPSSKTAAVRPFIDLEDPSRFDMETPNAPKRCGSCRPRISREKLTDISVALFHYPEEDVWQKNCGLFMETEI